MTTEEAFIAESNTRISKSFARIHHFLEQMNEDDVWWRPNDESNSMGNLVLHVCGNLRQWIVAGIGGAEDVRNRPVEFEPDSQVPTAELLELIEKLQKDMDSTLTGFDPAELLTMNRIQGYDRTNMEAIYSTVTHLEGHTGQIAYIAKLKLGADHKAFWKPESKEQESGADK